MKTNLGSLILSSEVKVPPRLVVRVKTEYYQTQRGAAIKKVINVLKRKSDQDAIDWFDTDISMSDTESVLTNIINIHQVNDGLYELIMCNRSYDWETGYLDGYQYNLIPYTDSISSP